jgi:hypothetical protein
VYVHCIQCTYTMVYTVYTLFHTLYTPFRTVHTAVRTPSVHFSTVYTVYTLCTHVHTLYDCIYTPLYTWCIHSIQWCIQCMYTKCIYTVCTLYENFPIHQARLYKKCTVKSVYTKMSVRFCTPLFCWLISFIWVLPGQ